MVLRMISQDEMFHQQMAMQHQAAMVGEIQEKSAFLLLLASGGSAIAFTL
jgi:hypothetical protein